MNGIQDGIGHEAHFYYPHGLAVDATGIYVADELNHTIRKITPTRFVRTIAGAPRNAGSQDGPGSQARFQFPQALAADGTGRVYVSDTYNHTIRVIGPDEVVSTLAGLAGIPGAANGAGNDARFYYPVGVSADAAGNVYVADKSNHTIRAISGGGVVSTVAGSAGFFNGPGGMAVDAAGTAYVADENNNTIRKITPSGIVTTLAGSPGLHGTSDGVGSAARFDHPSGVAIDSAGTLYVADKYNNTIRKITPAGLVSTLAGAPGASGSANGTGSEARFTLPAGVTVDSVGNIYVADFGNHTIRKITPDAAVSTLAGLAGVAGSADGVGEAARFSLPSSLAVDGSGNVYVADGGNYTVRKVTPQGATTTVAGSPGMPGTADGTGSVARFNYLRAIAVGDGGSLLVGDGNATLRRITSSNVVTTLAGLAGTPGTDDGRGSIARSYGIYGIAVTGSGNVYLADGAHTIRVGMPYTAVSRKLHAGIPYDIDLPLVGSAGIECRSGGANNEYQVIVTCYRPVGVANATVTSGSGTVATISGAGSSTIVIDLTQVATAQQISLTLAGLNDGSSTRDLTIPMGVLVGDTTGNGAVTSSDISQTKGQSGQPISAANFRNDVTANGSITSSDIGLVKSQSGMNLPSARPEPVGSKESQFLRH